MELDKDFKKWPVIASAYAKWASVKLTGGRSQYDSAVQLRIMRDECGRRRLSWYELVSRSLGHTRSGWELCNRMAEVVSVPELNDRNLWGKVAWKGVAKIYECRREGFDRELKALVGAIRGVTGGVTDRELTTLFKQHAPQTSTALSARMAKSLLEKKGYRKSFEAVLCELRSHLMAHPKFVKEFPIAVRIIGDMPGEGSAKTGKRKRSKGV